MNAAWIIWYDVTIHSKSFPLSADIATQTRIFQYDWIKFKIIAGYIATQIQNSWETYLLWIIFIIKWINQFNWYTPCAGDNIRLSKEVNQFTIDMHFELHYT